MPDPRPALVWPKIYVCDPEKADLNCLSDLLKKGAKWRYWINLCGQDFPLKSQNSISKYLSIVYPANIVESIHMPEGKFARYTQSFEILPGSDKDLGDSERAHLKIDHLGIS